MADIVADFLLSITDNRYLIVFLVSMFPLIELKGAIPIGQKLGLALYESAGIAYLGSTIIVLALFFLLVYVFALLKKIPFIKKLVEKIEYVLKEKARSLAEKSAGEEESVRRKMLVIGLFIFVAIPLPLTGVWTGTAIAVFLDMEFKNSVLPLAAGNLVAGTLITLLTLIFKQYVDIIITCIFVLALIMLVVLIVKLYLAKPKAEEKEEENDGLTND